MYSVNPKFIAFENIIETYFIIRIYNSVKLIIKMDLKAEEIIKYDKRYF